MSERTEIPAMNDIDRALKREMIDAVPGTYADAQGLWEAFVITHPEYGEYTKIRGVQFLTGSLSIEDALKRDDPVKYDGATIPLNRVAEAIVRRARQSPEHTAELSYEAWAQSKMGQVAIGDMKPDIVEQVLQQDELELAA